ncbi:MAG TPA: peptidylprolyl isomerase [Candidatus Limnocylindria bacterium]|nr:peptidylprolyl isomerase [Candidatus Limnocylindria bacterium]
MTDRPSAPRGDLDTSKSYRARFKTEKGDIVCELYADRVPMTVENFVNLARAGFYDGTTFHRVIPGFMAQGGDPTGTGRGGPGYDFADEFHPTLRHDAAGTLSMANAGANTNGSQFFLTFGPTPHLDDRHSVFGRVTEGMEVLRSIRERDPQTDRSDGDRITTIEIEES